MSTPSIVPHATERDVYLVLEDFGPHLGRAWRETDAERADRDSLLRDLVAGEFRPVRIVAFNAAEGWSRDVTVEIADELRRRYVEFGEVSDMVLEFMEANRR